jgi:hypothetical protein
LLIHRVIRSAFANFVAARRGLLDPLSPFGDSNPSTDASIEEELCDLRGPSLRPNVPPRATTAICAKPTAGVDVNRSLQTPPQDSDWRSSPVGGATGPVGEGLGTFGPVIDKTLRARGVDAMNRVARRSWLLLLCPSPPGPPPATEAAGSARRPSTAGPTPEAPRPNNPLVISPLKTWRKSPAPWESENPRHGNPRQPAGPLVLRRIALLPADWARWAGLGHCSILRRAKDAPWPEPGRSWPSWSRISYGSCRELAECPTPDCVRFS